MIREGDLLLTHNYRTHPLRVRSYLPPLIRKFTGSHWNHSANVIEQKGQLMVIEADYPHCTLQPLEQWMAKGKKDILHLRPLELDREQYRSVLTDAVGVPYDLSALLEQAKYHLTGRRNWRGRTEGTASKTYYCSELSAHAHNRPNWFLYWPGHFETDPAFEIIQ
jgi:hypothetical protein